MELTPELIWHGLLWWLVFLFSTTCHEAAHAWTAMRGGDLTAYLGGQVSLDPLPHVQREPLGMVVVPWLTYFLNGGGWMMGWASAPLNPHWVLRYPTRAALVSLAGPLANFTLVVGTGVVIRIGLAAGLLVAPDLAHGMSGLGGFVVPATSGAATFAELLGIFFQLNLVLCVFNLLPFPPLDGAGALPLLFGDAGASISRQAMFQPMLSMVGLVIAWQVFPTLFWPIADFALAVLYPEARLG